MKNLVVTGFFLGLIWVACKRSPVQRLDRPHFPVTWPSLSTVEDNPWDPERAALGRELFFETKLSKQSNVSCGTCHQPRYAWSTNEALVLGTEGTRFFRHPPSLLNVGFFRSWHWDGGTSSLEKQVLAPLENPDEMNMRLDTLLIRLRRDPYYRRRFQQVYRKAPDLYGLTRALAAYQRSLISARSKWDRVQQGEEVLSAKEARGEQLFFSDSLACSSCHIPPLFTDAEFHNNGLWSWSDRDLGYARVTLDSLDRGKFKTPTLRNLMFSAPYFHDGRSSSLQHVIDHYRSGGNHNILQDQRLRGFRLNKIDQTALLAFLMTLTDSTTLSDRRLLPDR